MVHKSTIFQQGSGGVTSLVNSDGSLTLSGSSGNITISVNDAHLNTWTGGQILAPSSTTVIAQTIKQHAGSTVDLLDITDSSNNKLFYIDSSGNANVSENIIMHNVVGGSLLALNNSNIVTGINTLTNITYNATTSTIAAIPSGSTTDYQFNNGGIFAGDGHAIRNSDTSSTFSGTADFPATPGGFGYVTNYSSTGITSGYSTDGSTKGYKLYSYKLSPIDGSKYYSADPTPDYVQITDNNSQINPQQPSAFSVMQNTSGSGYIANGQVFTYYIWSWETVNGVTIYAAGQQVAGYTDTINDGTTPFENDLSWIPATFDAGSTATGYIINRDINGNGFPDYIVISGGSTAAYADTDSGWITATAPQTPNVAQDFFQNVLSWTSSAGAAGYKIVYSPNNFSPITTGSPSVSGAADLSYSGYNNQALVYQVYAYQVVGGVNVFSTYATLYVSDSSGNNFGVDINITPPTFSPYSTGNSNAILRSLDGGVTFPDYLYQPASFVDTNSGWTTGVPTLTPTSIIYSLEEDVGNVTTFTDTGSISYNTPAVISPNSVGPFGATLGGSYGLSTSGTIEVNSNYIFAATAPSAGQIQVAQASGPLLWETLSFGIISGGVSYSQLPLTAVTQGNIVLANGSTLGYESLQYVDFGVIYESLRSPNFFAYGVSAYQLSSNSGAAQWVKYAYQLFGSTNSYQIDYNLQSGAYYNFRSTDGDTNNTGYYASENAFKPTAKLHIAGNTSSSPGNASFKLGVSSNLLTTPENGAIENNGTHLYYTAGGTRYQLDQQSGSGTVTAVSVASANGFAGTVANATTTPAITVSTSVTGILLGNGTSISASNVTNDVQTKAAIVPNTAPAAGQILVGNAGGTAYAPVTASGAFTLASTGAATIATPGTLTVSSTNSTATAHTHAITSSSAPGAAASLLATDSSGIIGSTGTRIVKIWATDIETTNAPTAGGVAVPTISSTNTLTNKRFTPRTGTTTSSATPTINTDNVDAYLITAQAAAITSFTTNLSGTPTAEQKLMIAITDNGSPQTIAWGSSFESTTVTLPTTTVASTKLRVGFLWNTSSSKWSCVAVA